MARKPKSETPRNSRAVDELRGLVDELVGIAEEQEQLKDRASEIAARAKSQGWDVKALKKIVKERLEDDAAKAKRLETEEIADVYRAALGMLDGTPLGEATRDRLNRDREPEGEAPIPNEQPSIITPETIAEARDQGRQACRDGKAVTDNPFTARDPRRAAWDEGWCFEAGSDGMDIPEAFRRRKPAKEEPAKDTDADEGNE